MKHTEMVSILSAFGLVVERGEDFVGGLRERAGWVCQRGGERLIWVTAPDGKSDVYFLRWEQIDQAGKWKGKTQPEDDLFTVRLFARWVTRQTFSVGDSRLRVWGKWRTANTGMTPEFTLENDGVVYSKRYGDEEEESLARQVIRREMPIEVFFDWLMDNRVGVTISF